MGTNILNIGKSGLFAAQVGLSTTGHNIANANVAGYNRQVVVQKAAAGQDLGTGFIGGGTEVAEVKRYYDDFLTAQVRTAQSSKSALDSFHSQISQVDNLLSDTTSGLSPAMQDFFKGVQDLASNPASVASRQAMLSASESLAGRFQGLNGRLAEIREGVNSQITSNVVVINSFARQIAQLNDNISGLSAAGKVPNDLLDQRDQLIADLNKQVKATVVPGDNNTLTVSIGSGQPLVVGKQAYALAATTSPTDLTRVEVGYVTGSKTTVLAESALTGGELGGLFDFRANTLDRAQNSLGRIAISLANTFNNQHKLGLDLSGQAGENYFVQAPVSVTASTSNTGNAAVSAVVTDATKLTASDYKLEYDGTKFNVTRQPDGTSTPITSVPQVIDGVEYTISGSAAKGDKFAVRPTYNGAGDFKVAITDRSKIAAGAADAMNGVGDNRNALALGALQSSKILDGGTASFQGSYAELVSFVGNKTREVQVNATAGAALLAQSREAQQSVSGVNLDEEAANLLRYQQAYQAAGKVMQIASQLFDVLLSLGR